MKNKGYNLIDVLVAIALLAWVVFVIAGLLTYAQREIYSGKQQTKAVALGQKIYEDLAKLEKEQKYKIFKISDSATSPATIDILPSDPNRHDQNQEPVLYNTFQGWLD